MPWFSAVIRKKYHLPRFHLYAFDCHVQASEQRNAAPIKQKPWGYLASSNRPTHAAVFCLLSGSMVSPVSSGWIGIGWIGRLEISQARNYSRFLFCWDGKEERQTWTCVANCEMQLKSNSPHAADTWTNEQQKDCDLLLKDGDLFSYK